MKKTITIICCLLLLSLSSHAQQGYYCLSFADYLINKWQPLDKLRTEHRSGSQKFWNGGASIKPTTGNKQIDKMLKNEAKLIKYRDSLYVNCHELSCHGTSLGNWYAPAFIYERDYFLFIAPSYKAAQHVGGMAFAFGLIGGSIAASKAKDDYLCYILNPSTETVEAVDKQMMQRLLAHRPDLQARLKNVNKKQRYSPEVILPILQSLGLVEGLPTE
ncbi:MAG: hypothetical protein IJ841_12050 [Prevotella sp.]|nr:hypothetical protein [Prevotella sp.]